jgi:hypothetical protein
MRHFSRAVLRAQPTPEWQNAEIIHCIQSGRECFEGNKFDVYRYKMMIE